MARSGFALKFLQFFNRIIQFLCAAVILGIFSYFLATLHNHNLRITNQVRAVEGISGAAVLYTLIALLLLCCLAGIALFSIIAIILDILFIGAFIYIAWANRDGAGSCKGYVDTPFGRGQSTSNVQGSSGFTSLPSFHTACRLQTACLAVAIIAIFFFLFSIITEIFLRRHHRKEKRFGPSPRNDYTSGSGRRQGFLGRMFGRKKRQNSYDDNGLPEHTHPGQLDRPSYATETTAVNDGHAYNTTKSSKVENGYGYQNTAGDGYQNTAGDGYRNTAGDGYRNTAGDGYNGLNYSRPTTQASHGGNYRYEDGVYDRTAA